MLLRVAALGSAAACREFTTPTSAIGLKRAFTVCWPETMPGGSSLDRTGGIQPSQYLPRQS